MQWPAISNLWGCAAARFRQTEFRINVTCHIIDEASRRILVAIRERRRTCFSTISSRPVALMMVGTVLSLAGCSSAPGSFDVQQSTQTKLTDLMALVQFKKLPKQPEPTDHVACPDITILDGTADDRVYGKGGTQTNADVRYQFSLNDVARDCRVVGDQISLKIGAAGKILLGPLGSPGSFIAPIRVAIVRESDQKPVVSKLYRLGVNVPTGQTEAPFTLVTEPLNVPYTHENAQHDYTIKVGFDAAPSSGEKTASRKHRQHSNPTND